MIQARPSLATRWLDPLPRAGAVWRRWTHRRELGALRELLPSLTSRLGAEGSTWRVLQVQWTHTDVVVMSLGAGRDGARAVLKVAQSGYPAASLRRQYRTLARVHADRRLSDWQVLVPRPLAAGEMAGRVYLFEQALPGREARLLVRRAETRQQIHARAAAAIGHLHQRTGARVVIDEARLQEWIDSPLARLERLLGAQEGAEQARLATRRLKAELREAFAGQAVRLGWIHGDFWVGNLLVSPDGTVSGLVDWDRAAEHEPALHDLVHLILQTRRVVARQPELGEAMRGVLTVQPLTAEERAAFEAADLAPPRGRAEERAAVLLYWLRYIVGYLEQYPRRTSDSTWLLNNVARVLTCA